MGCNFLVVLSLGSGEKGALESGRGLFLLFKVACFLPFFSFSWLQRGQESRGAETLDWV